MFEIIRLGERTVHDHTFFVDRPKGHFPYGEPISLHQPSEYHSLFHLLAMEFFGTSGNREETMRYLLSALLCKLDNEVELKEYPDIYYDLRTLRGQIFSKPDMDWRVDQMAKYLNISEGYLHASYKKYFGTSCMNDVICARIEYACEYFSIFGGEK